ncbi:hypothetical protein K440DRAFT_628779 [Wilcoxina mikolae CBS 423.85]|nr:hypothetical protein K440DRAFT_628779 [Wilcoxina mikolae CBS 423.85]
MSKKDLGGSGVMNRSSEEEEEEEDEEEEDAGKNNRRKALRAGRVSVEESEKE